MRNTNFNNALLIYNPSSRGGKLKTLFNEYFYYIKRNITLKRCDVFESLSHGHTEDKIKEIHSASDKYDLLICLGGDGLLSSICNSQMKIPFKKRLPILPLPGGSGNSFLKDFNIGTLKEGVDNFNQKQIHLVDLCHVQGVGHNFSWYCINLLGLGFVTDIVIQASINGKKHGALSYLTAALQVLRKFRPYKTTVTYNNGKNRFTSDHVYLMTVSNTKYTGGKIMVAPDACFNDGMMDVMILHDINRFQFIKGFVKTFKGAHTQEKGCFIFQTDNLEIHSQPNFGLMPDGEISGKSPIKITIVPKQIKIIL